MPLVGLKPMTFGIFAKSALTNEPQGAVIHVRIDVDYNHIKVICIIFHDCINSYTR